MLKVEFENLGAVDDSLLKFAVIVSRHRGKWVWCRHVGRNTWEAPGGHIEPGENSLDAAKRELMEETGALAFELTPICVYYVNGDIRDSGILCFAEIAELGPLSAYEMETGIERIQFFDEPPAALTYPEIQPQLMAKVRETLDERCG